MTLCCALSLSLSFFPPSLPLFLSFLLLCTISTTLMWARGQSTCVVCNLRQLKLLSSFPPVYVCAQLLSSDKPMIVSIPCIGIFHIVCPGRSPRPPYVPPNCIYWHIWLGSSHHKSSKACYMTSVSVQMHEDGLTGGGLSLFVSSFGDQIMLL